MCEVKDLELSAVIDRFNEDGSAVILAETIGKEFVVRAEELPTSAERGSWITAKWNKDRLECISLDQTKTAQQAEQVKDKLKQLRARSSGSQFKKK
ncbi:DUF3006 domain-containing protein [Amphibacillus sediminis]|uniref:DUF3006 domain-containing protein n=1 Tax=Amphibacillus sediminis TaxID=360185 RepID=UPI00082D1A55|nr:DUF3006 domain-containing protein [Amphibacillus sediminis]